MGQSEIEKRNEITLNAIESFQRMVLGFMPGNHLIDEFLNFRSKLLQKRVLNFSERLQNTFQEISGIDISGDAFTTEEFVDVFNLVIKRIQNTNSEFKLERFKNILVKQIVQPIDLFTTLRYAEMLNEMEDIHIEILDAFRKHSYVPYPFISNFAKLLTGNYEDNRQQTGHIEIEIAGSKISLEQSEIDFYGNHLVSLGLILKQSISKTSTVIINSQINTIEYFIISQTGLRFLEFIKEY